MESFQKIIKTGCKVNTYLAITNILPNGYHELESIFLPIATPSDTIIISPTKLQGLNFRCSLPDLSGKNIVIKAYDLYKQKTGFAPNLDIFLEKIIPIGGGLGGGSANAAAILIYLNETSPKKLNLTELKQIALKIGADVPFFIENKPALVRGIGEIIEPLDICLQNRTIFIVEPALKISTIDAYNWFDNAYANKEVELKSACLTNHNLVDINAVFRVDLFFNSFEKVVFEKFPNLEKIKTNIGQLGALCVLSGSGSCMVIVAQEEQVEIVREFLTHNALRYFENKI